MVTLVACAWWIAPSGAQAGAHTQKGPPAAVSAAFRPLVLGAATTVSFAVQIDAARSALMPVTSVEVRYPAELGLGTSQLGLEVCSPSVLHNAGPRACPADSKMGQGSGVIEVPFGPGVVHERVALSIFAAPSSDGYIHLAIAAQGKYPVIAHIVLAGVLLPGRMKITVPPVPTLPGAPDASVVSMQASLGGALTYYERVHGRIVAFRPRGIGLPDSCPRGGWRIAASFTFAGRSTSRAATVVPCPVRS
jgi:hypothetical protein